MCQSQVPPFSVCGTLQNSAAGAWRSGRLLIFLRLVVRGRWKIHRKNTAKNTPNQRPRIMSRHTWAGCFKSQQKHLIYTMNSMARKQMVQPAILWWLFWETWSFKIILVPVWNWRCQKGTPSLIDWKLLIDMYFLVLNRTHAFVIRNSPNTCNPSGLWLLVPAIYRSFDVKDRFVINAFGLHS